MGFSAACSDSPEARKQKALGRGEEYFKERKLNEAIIELQNALQVDKEFVPALHALGRAYAGKYWFLDAVRELGRAQRLVPDSLPIAGDFGRALVEIGAWEEAEDEAKKILAREPGNVLGQYIRAAALLGRAKPEEALAILDALPKAGALPDIEPARAQALVTLGKTAEAEQLLRAALARDPRDARSMAGLGAIHLARREYAEAARLYNGAKALAPEDPRMRMGLAAALARLGQVAEAITELEELSPRAMTAVVVRALALYYLEADRAGDAIPLLSPLVAQLPRYTQARFLLGLAYLATQNATQALTEFQELERQLPDDPAIQFRLAQAEVQLGRPREGLARLEGLAKSFGKIAEYHLERGRALVLLGRLPEALRAADSARELAPEAPQPYLLLGEIRAQQGNLRAAREMFVKAAGVGAGYAPAHMALGRFLLAEGLGDEALRQFDEAVRASPHSLVAVREKAMALVHQKRAKDAIQFVQARVKAEPRNPGLQSLLGGLYMSDKQLDRAAEAYRKALGMAPKTVEALLGLTSVALLKGQEEEAVGHLQQVVAVQPAHGPAVLLLIALLGKQGRSDLAVPVMEAAVAAGRQQVAFALVLGDLYLKTGRYEDAIGRMTDLLGRSPDLLPARLIRGQAQLAKGNAAAALTEMTEAVRRHPRSAEAQYFLAHAYVGVGRTREAQAAYREALRLDPQLETAKLELAALGGEQLDEAVYLAQIEQLQRAIKADPKNVRLRESLARVLFLSGQAQGAQSELESILAVAPLHLGANFLTARLLLQQGKGEEAARYLETVLRSNPSHVESLLLLARNLEGRGRLADAIVHLENALRVDPNLPDAKLRLGLLYVRTARLEEAAAIAADLERSAPRSPGGSLLRGMVLLDQKNSRGAVEAFSAALRLKPDLADAHRGLGQAWEALGQADRAMESYQRALSLNGTDAIALNNLAWVLNEMRKQPEAALPFALKAAQLAPQSPEVLDTLGWIQYRRGVYGEAERVLLRAVERAPASAPIHYHLGMAYYRLGKKNDALYTLRRAAQLDPKLAETEKLAALIKELEG